MDLPAACAVFSTATARDPLAKSATLVIEASQRTIRDGLAEEAGAALTYATAWSRRVAVDHAVRDVRSWAKCDTLSLVETGPWDALHLLIFLCQCHMRASLARIYTDGGEWGEAWGELPTDALPVDEDFRTLRLEDIRESREELDGGVDALGVRATLSSTPFRRVSAALVVCLDGIVEETVRSSDELFSGSRPSRLGVRLLERRALEEDAGRLLSICLESHPLEQGEEELFVHAEIMKEWMRRTIKIDANNSLLLRMDDWAVMCALTSDDINFATGERGVVPREHHSAPAAWVAQKALPDVEYRALMSSAKVNDAHPENAYLAFSGTLEQHYGFEWLTRCFVARVNPTRAFRKTCEFLKSAREGTPPLVVQREGGGATVLIRGADGIVRRVECTSPTHALSAWMVAVERHTEGQYSRKANVAPLIDRMRSTPEMGKLGAQDVVIGGANINIKI